MAELAPVPVTLKDGETVVLRSAKPDDAGFEREGIVRRAFRLADGSSADEVRMGILLAKAGPKP